MADVNMDQVRAIADFNNGKFTTRQFAAAQGLKDDVARKILKGLSELEATQEIRDNRKVTLWGFKQVEQPAAPPKAKRNIKKADYQRADKISKYLRAACYNASKINMGVPEIRAMLAGWEGEYELSMEPTNLCDDLLTDDEPVEETV